MRTRSKVTALMVAGALALAIGGTAAIAQSPADDTTPPETEAPSPPADGERTPDKDTTTNDKCKFFGEHFGELDGVIHGIIGGLEDLDPDALDKMLDDITKLDLGELDGLVDGIVKDLDPDALKKLFDGIVGGLEFDGEFDESFEGPFELSDDVIAEINAEGADLAAALDAAGVAYQMVADDVGITYPQWDESDPAANETVEQYYADKFGDLFGFGIFEDFDFDFDFDFDENLDFGFDMDLPEEAIAEINAEGADLAAVLDAAGIAHEMVTDDVGITYPQWDESDPAANEAVEQYYADKFGELPFQGIFDGIFDEGFTFDFGMDFDALSDENCEMAFGELFELPDDVVADINAEGAELAAALDAAGVTYEMVTDESGITFPEWDKNDDTANEAVEQYYVDKYGVGADGETPFGRFEFFDDGFGFHFGGKLDLGEFDLGDMEKKLDELLKGLDGFDFGSVDELLDGLFTPAGDTSQTTDA